MHSEVVCEISNRSQSVRARDPPGLRGSQKPEQGCLCLLSWLSCLRVDHRGNIPNWSKREGPRKPIFRSSSVFKAGIRLSLPLVGARAPEALMAVQSA